MALKRPVDSYKGIELINTYNRIKYHHSDVKVVQELIVDEDENPVLDKDGNNTYNYNKETHHRVVIAKYKSKEDSDIDKDLIDSVVVDFVDNTMDSTNTKCFKEKLYIKLKENEFSDCEDIIEL